MEGCPSLQVLLIVTMESCPSLQVLPIVNAVLPIVNGVLPIVNGVLPIVNGVLPIVNGVLPIINGVLPIVNGVLPSSAFEPLFRHVMVSSLAKNGRGPSAGEKGGRESRTDCTEAASHPFALCWS